MTQKFSNNARALLQTGISAAATSLAIEAAKADRFPIANTSNWLTPVDWFKVSVTDTAGNMEIMYVGTRAGGSGTLSVLQRGKEGTTALSFSAGSFVQLGITSLDVQNALAGILTAPQLSTPAVTGLVTQDGVTGRVTPVGGIIMYSGAVAAIPAGWQLCNGTNGTPDLRDKFVIGAGTDLAGVSQTNVTAAQTKSGGAKDATLPNHNHTANSTFAGSALAAHNHGVNDPGHTHQVDTAVGGGFIGLINLNGGGAAQQTTQAAGTGISLNAASAGTPAGTVSTTVNNSGNSALNANLPPYFALAFIQCMTA